MKDKNNIDELFKDAFSDYEAEVSPSEIDQSWNNISDKVSQGAGSASGSAAQSVAGKIGKAFLGSKGFVAVAGLAIAGAAIFTTVNLISPEDNEEGTQQLVHVNENADSNKPEQFEGDRETAKSGSGNVKDERGSLEPIQKQANRSKNQTQEVSESSNEDFDGFERGSNSIDNADGGKRNPQNSRDTDTDPEKTPEQNNSAEKNILNKESSALFASLRNEEFCVGEKIKLTENEINSLKSNQCAKISGQYLEFVRAGICQLNLNNEELQITVNANPEINITSTLDDNILEARVTDPDPDLIYTWEFGDGKEAEDFIVNNFYESAGNYRLSAFAYNEETGCETEKRKMITINELREPIVPNIFTPNNDGHNDVWQIKAKGLAEFYVKVFDKEGNIVFETENIEIDWEGRLPGERGCTQKEYTYQLVYRYEGQKERQEKQGKIFVACNQ